VISETSNFSELKQLVSEDISLFLLAVKHIGRESFSPVLKK
jgi:hypothetical protein